MATSDQQSAMRLGFIGLGSMGSRMASRLLAARYDLVVYNRTRKRTHPLEQLGAQVAATLKEPEGGAAVMKDGLTSAEGRNIHLCLVKVFGACIVGERGRR